MTTMIAAKKTQSFRNFVAAYSAKHIASVIGCSLPTAYDWRSGRRSPPTWLHKRYIEALNESTQQNKRR
jgi:hypothetical protein